MTYTLTELTARIRVINIDKGWRPADGSPGTNTEGDYFALLHSEASEALEAFRSWKLEDATKKWGGEAIVPETGLPSKPEGVGSELADCIIRFLDMCDVFGIKLDLAESTLADIPTDPEEVMESHGLTTVGDWIDWIHGEIVDWRRGHSQPEQMLYVLTTTADQFNIDLTAEVDRKIAYNRTRPHLHGNRAL